jgi:predicted phosphohydrolase
MKVAWLTDIHLEFLDTAGVSRFARKVREASPDVVLISGDIAQAPTIADHLANLAHEAMRPIYFVLGNHDFYHGSIVGVRTRVRNLSAQSNGLHWLNDAGVVRLTPRTCLVGHDGWGDGRLGDFHSSEVRLNDFLLIEELTGLHREDLLTRLHHLGDEAAEHFRRVLPEALEEAEHVVVLTHVPPFLESSWYDGRYCDADWLPFFSCQAVGNVLAEFMRRHMTRRMTVLCGHTHGGGTSQILANLVTVTGSAQYGRPVIQNLFEWK